MGTGDQAERSYCKRGAAAGTAQCVQEGAGKWDKVSSHLMSEKLELKHRTAARGCLRRDVSTVNHPLGTRRSRPAAI